MSERQWNTLVGVVEIIEADTGTDAAEILAKKLEAAGFSAYPLDGLLGPGIQAVFEDETSKS